MRPALIDIIITFIKTCNKRTRVLLKTYDKSSNYTRKHIGRPNASNSCNWIRRFT